LKYQEMKYMPPQHQPALVAISIILF
jgi:hypothetical protein